jgi:hypothetical protein
MKLRQSRRFRRQLVVFSLAAITALVSTRVAGQQQKDEVLRINTDLVQSAITVIDKQRQLVDASTAGNSNCWSMERRGR